MVFFEIPEFEAISSIVILLNPIFKNMSVALCSILFFIKIDSKITKETLETKIVSAV